MVERRKRAQRRIQPRILIILLILSIPPLVVGHFLLVRRARQNYLDMVSANLSQRAEAVQTDLINYVERMSIQVANLGSVPDVQRVVRESNAQRLAQQRFDRDISEIEEQWGAMETESSRLLRDILEGATSQFLRNYNTVATAFREILVTDVYGRLVAATNKSSDYFQADERWWMYTYQEGSGNRFVSDLQFDESADVYGIEIAEPIRDPASRAVIGVVKVVVDSHEIFSLVEGVEVGENGEAVLLRPDKTVIYSAQPKSKYETVDVLEEARGSSVEAMEIQAFPEQRRPVRLGLPLFPLEDKLPELDWYVAVQVPEAEVLAPFRNINRWFLYIVSFSVTAVVILSLFFTWLLSKPAIETDPHLERL